MGKISTSTATTPTEAMLEALEQENQVLRESTSDLQKQIEQLEAFKEKCARELEAKKKEFASSMRQAELKFAAEKDKIKKELTAQKTITADLESTVNQTDRFTTELKKQLDSEKRRADTEKKRADTEKSRADNLQLNFNSASEEANGLRTQIKEKDQKISELNQRIWGLNQEIEHSSELPKPVPVDPVKINSLEKMVSNLQVENKRKDNRIKRHAIVFIFAFILSCVPSVYFYIQTEEYKSKNWSLSRQADSLRQETDSLTKDLNDLQDSVGSMEEENGSLKENISSLEEENGSLKENISSLKSKLNSLENTNKEASDKLNSIQPEYNFYHNGAVIVYNNNTNLYHKYGCSKVTAQEYWIYNIELAKSKNYTPCPTCFPKSKYDLSLIY